MDKSVRALRNSLARVDDGRFMRRCTGACSLGAKRSLTSAFEHLTEAQTMTSSIGSCLRENQQATSQIEQFNKYKIVTADTKAAFDGR